MVRVDNNKVALHVQSLNLVQSKQNEIQSFDTTIVIPHDHKLQLFNLDEDHRNVHNIDVKPRNYVSNANVADLPISKVAAYAFTPDKTTLLSVVNLEDTRTQIKVRSLKILKNNNSGEWEISHFAHIYDTTSDRIKVSSISNTSFAVSLGKIT